MNKRQVIVLWVIALVLTAALVIVNSSKSDGYQASTKRERGDTLLPDFNPAEVAGVTITRGDESVRLVRKDGAWVVTNRDDYPANVSSINELLRTLAEVKVTQGIEADPEFAPRFGMDPEASEDAEKGVGLVLSNDAGTELAHLTFGKNTESAANPMNPFGGGASGRFVRNHADTSGIYVTSELFPSLNADASSWLDEDFLRVEKIQSISVSKPGQENEPAWKLTREDEAGDFTLVDKKADEELDTSAINPLKNLFSYARFEDVVPAAEVDGAWDKEQRRQAVITTFEGLTYNVTFGPGKSAESGDSEDYLMRVAVTADLPGKREPAEEETEDQAKQADEEFESRRKDLEEKLETAKQLEGRTFRVTKFTVDALLKDRADLIKEAEESGADTSGNMGAAGNPPMLRPGNTGPVPPRPPATAVTPPIAIPPLPRPGDAEDDRPAEDAPAPEPDPAPAPDAGAEDAPDPGTVEESDTGTEDAPDSGTEDAPDSGTVEESETGPQEAPDSGTVEEPDAGTVEEPDAGAGEAPDAGAEDAPDAGAGDAADQEPRRGAGE